MNSELRKRLPREAEDQDRTRSHRCHLAGPSSCVIISGNEQQREPSAFESYRERPATPVARRKIVLTIGEGSRNDEAVWQVWDDVVFIVCGYSPLAGIKLLSFKFAINPVERPTVQLRLEGIVFPVLESIQVPSGPQRRESSEISN